MRMILAGSLLALLLAAGVAAWMHPDPWSISAFDFFTLDNIILGRERPQTDPFTGDFPRRYRLAILAYQAPDMLQRKGKAIADHLETHQSARVVPMFPASYESLSALLEADGCEIVWCSPFIWRRLRDRIHFTVGAKIAIQNRDTYGSLLIVRRDDPAQSIQDLKGRRIAYVDMQSSSGFYIPNIYLHSLGIDPAAHFSQMIFSGNHDLAVRDLLENRADVAAVYDRVMEVESGLFDTAEIRILCHAGVVPNAPILIANSVPENERKEIQRLLLDAGSMESGRKMLEVLYELDHLTQFLPAKDSDYDF